MDYNELKTIVRKNKFGFCGYIKCIDGKKTIWTEKAGPTRICREDAQDDADRLKKDREATWKL